MSNESRNLGTQFETAVLKSLRASGFDTERLARAGKLDEGDLAVTIPAGQLFIIECKARRDRMSTQNFGAWLGEAATEAGHYAKARGLSTVPPHLLVVKRPQKSIGQAFAIQTLEAWINDHIGPDSP